MAVSRSPKPFMGVRIPLPLLCFKDRCHELTAVLLFALRASIYAGLVPFLALSDVVRCLIQSVLLDMKKWGKWGTLWGTTWGTTSERAGIPPVMPFYVWELSIKAASCYNEIAAYD